MKVATFTKTNYDYKPLDEFPFPDYEPFGIKDMMDNYSQATRLLYRYTRENPRPYGIVTSRGCPFSCSFCTPHQGYRERSIENIIEEIRTAYDKYHFNILIILDELFAVNKRRMIEFCAVLQQERNDYGWDFDWMFQTHASAKLDLETLKMAKDAGCVSFSYGLESASPTVLESMGKKIIPEQVIEAIKLAAEAKVGFSANLIFGDTAETMETIAESLAFWFENARSSFIFLSNVAPYPGSALFETCRKRGMFQNKQEYYEKVNELNVNMTSIAEREFSGHQQLIKFLDQTWLFTKTTPITKLEQLPDSDKLIQFQGGFYYHITANCPYCGEEIYYKERLMETKTFWLGTGCPKCQSKIKVVS